MNQQVEEAVAKIRDLEEVEGRTFDSLMKDFYLAIDTTYNEQWVLSGYGYLIRFLPNNWSTIIDVPYDYAETNIWRGHQKQKEAALAILEKLGVVSLSHKKYKHLYNKDKRDVWDVLETKDHLLDIASKKYGEKNFGAMHEIDAILRTKFKSGGLPNLPTLQAPDIADSSKIARNALLRLIETHPIIFTRHFNSKLLSAGHAKPLEWTEIDPEIKKILQ